MSHDLLIPAEGTLERIALEKLATTHGGVTFLDFVGTGITEDNIDQVMKNLMTGMFIAENDNELKPDAKALRPTRQPARSNPSGFFHARSLG